MSTAAPALPAGRAPTRPRSPWRIAAARVRRDRLALVALGFLVALVLAVSAGAPLAAHLLGHGPNDPFPYAVDVNGKTVGPWTRVPALTSVQQPGAGELPPPPRGTKSTLLVLGGDGSLGRDEFLRVLYGGRVTLEVALGATLLALLLGVGFGAVAGYFGGWVDELIMRVVDVLMAFPFLILVIAIMSILGPGLTNLYIAVGVVGWIPYARITRGETLATRHLEYVLAARTIGCSSGRIMLRHILPNVIAPALIYVFTGMVLAILTGATLSFLGLGPQPPTPEWGAMIAEGRQYLLLAWWMTTLPGLALLVVGVALSLIGDGLAERRGG